MSGSHSNPRSSARPHVQSLAGEPLILTGCRRPVLIVATALFWPSGADALSEEERALDVADLETRIAATIERFGGTTLAAAAGRSVSVWGYPSACVDDGSRALAAARSLQRLAALTRRPRATLGIGRAVGPAIIMRSARRNDGRPTIFCAAITQAESMASAAGARDDGAAAQAWVEANEHRDEALARLDQRSRSERTLLRVLAVLQRPTDATQLAEVTTLPVAAVRSTLLELEAVSIVNRLSIGTYTFWRLADASLEIAARDLVLERDRRALHRRAAIALGRRSVSFDRRQAEIAAWHADQSHDASLLFEAANHAAHLAIQDGDSTAAASFLVRACDAATKSADGIDPIAALSTFSRLATQLGAIRGNAAPEVVAHYRQSLSLLECLSAGREGERFELLWGLHVSDLVRGEIANANLIALEIRRLADALQRDDLQLVCARMLGLTALMAGDLDAARAGFGQTLQLYQADRHADLRFRFSSDQKAVALAGLAWVETIAGDGDSAERFGREALNAADRVQHPHTCVHVRGVLAVAAQMRGDRDRAAEHAAIAHDTAVAHDFVYWIAWAEFVLGWLQLDRTPEQAAVSIGRAIDRYQATGARQALPYAWTLEADALRASGNEAQASDRLTFALELAGAGRVELYRPEILHRLGICGVSPVAAQTEKRALVLKSYRLARARGAELFARNSVAALIEAEALQPGGGVAVRRAVLEALG